VKNKLLNTSLKQLIISLKQFRYFIKTIILLNIVNIYITNRT